MTFVDPGPYKFSYDSKRSYNENFLIWSQLNHEEKIAFNEQTLSLKEQKEIFSELFSEKAWLR